MYGGAWGEVSSLLLGLYNSGQPACYLNQEKRALEGTVNQTHKPLDLKQISPPLKMP